MKKEVLFYLIIGALLHTWGCSDKDEFAPEQEIIKVEETKNFKSTQNQLDYGLYWYDENGEKERYEIGKNNTYYDPSKPIIIFFHGQSTNIAKNGERRNFFFEDANEWVDKGWYDNDWNVGIMHWEVWADEATTIDAEAKIYTRNGPQGFRYMLLGGYDSDRSYPLNPEGDDAVGEIAYNYISNALICHENSEVRFVGHSLGSQLSTRVANLIYENISNGNLNESCRVNRLALLDPAWTKNGKDWWNGDNDLDANGENDWVGERTRWAIFDMMNEWSDFAVEIYSSTALDKQLGVAMDANLSLREKVCCTSLRPWYYNAIELKEKHNAAIYHYMWSIAYNPPVECTIDWFNKRTATGDIAPSASTSNSKIVSMMDSDYVWDQVEGRYTYTPIDDWFERKYR